MQTFPIPLFPCQMMPSSHGQQQAWVKHSKSYSDLSAKVGVSLLNQKGTLGTEWMRKQEEALSDFAILPYLTNNAPVKTECCFELCETET